MEHYSHYTNDKLELTLLFTKGFLTSQKKKSYYFKNDCHFLNLKYDTILY